MERRTFTGLSPEEEAIEIRFDDRPALQEQLGQLGQTEDRDRFIGLLHEMQEEHGEELKRDLIRLPHPPED